jgi:hypothetical protein
MNMETLKTLLRNIANTLDQLPGNTRPERVPVRVRTDNQQ